MVKDREKARTTMAAIPFIRDVNIPHGVIEELSPLIRRVTANNPGGFTFTGTGTYIIGRGNVAVIDPGPLLDAHLQAIETALAGETITHILVTHTHNDHSPAAKPLKESSGAPTYAYGPHGGERAAERDEGADWDFSPDVVVKHGDIIEGDGWSMECVFTPGHTSNHMCFALREEKALFTGDHVMGWSTSIVSPPDGNMKTYMDSLALLLERDDAVYWPTHGDPIRDTKSFVQAFIDHRENREVQIAEQLRSGHSQIKDMIPVMYADVDKRLYPAAARSVFAHMIHMVETGRVRCDGTPEINSVYALA